jgi:hypothetical protein
MMNLMEMVCVMFAMVFFTSVALIYNRGAWSQKERLYDANSFVQATVLAHSVLDEIDAKLLSKDLAFDQIITNYNVNRNVNLDYVGEAYALAITAVQADSTGQALATPITGSIYTRVSVRVSALSGLREPIQISRLFTKTHLNL